MKKLIFVMIALSSLSAHAQLDEAGQGCSAFSQMRSGREATLKISLKKIADLATKATADEFTFEVPDQVLGQIAAEAKKIAKLRDEIKDLRQAQDEYCQ